MSGTPIMPEGRERRTTGSPYGRAPSVSVDGRLLAGRLGHAAAVTVGPGGVVRAEAGERATQALECVADLAGHDPQLVRVAFGDLRQHLQVLVGQEFLVGVAGVDRL